MNKKNLIQIIIILGISAMLIGGLTWWAEHQGRTINVENSDLFSDEVELEGPLSPEALEAKSNEAIVNDMNPKAVFQTNKGTFEIELYASEMPITTGNFIKLAEEGYYNGTKFHRVIENFMIQGGDSNTKTDNAATYGQGGPGYTIEDEFIAGEKLSNVRGTIAMANTGQPNSGGSQFFINTVDNTNLDFDKEPLTSKHPVFGHVISGMEVVDAISQVETGPRDLPVEPVVIESVTIVKAGG